MAKKQNMTKRTTKKASSIPATRVAPPPAKSPVKTPAASTPTARGNGNSKPRGIALEPTVLSHDKIAQRAYLLWQKTGNTDPARNWSEAERQLRRECGVA